MEHAPEYLQFSIDCRRIQASRLPMGDISGDFFSGDPVEPGRGNQLEFREPPRSAPVPDKRIPLGLEPSGCPWNEFFADELRQRRYRLLLTDPGVKSEAEAGHLLLDGLDCSSI
jgi:hypothetical protein